MRYVVDIKALDEFIFNKGFERSAKRKEELFMILTAAKDADRIRRQYRERCETFRSVLVETDHKLSDLSRSVSDIHLSVASYCEKLDELKQEADRYDRVVEALITMLKSVRPDLYNKIPFLFNADH